jgi:CheY-like chemotaxis protein
MAHCILFIDDKPRIRQQVEALLEAHGYEVVLAANAPQAYSLLNQTAVDAVVCDLLALEPDGLDFIRSIQAEQALSELPVVLISTAGLDEANPTTGSETVPTTSKHQIIRALEAALLVSTSVLPDIE